MRPDVVVVVAPQGQLSAGIGQAVEDLLVQAFVAQAAIEGLDVAVLLRLAGIDVMPFDAVLVGPLQDRLAGELGSVVADEASRFAVDANQGVKFSRHSGPRYAGVGNQGQVLAAAIVVDRQNAELAAYPDRVRQEVQGPALFRLQRHRHWCPTAACPFAATPAAPGQTFFPVDAVDLLFVHDHAFALQHDAHTPIPEATPLLGDLVHLLTDFRVIGRPLTPHSLRIDTDQDAGPALRDRMTLHRPQNRVPPRHRCRQGFPNRSFRTTLSNIASASRRFSFAFSSSSCFSRFASDRSIPPYLAFSL